MKFVEYSKYIGRQHECSLMSPEYKNKENQRFERIISIIKQLKCHLLFVSTDQHNFILDKYRQKYRSIKLKGQWKIRWTKTSSTQKKIKHLQYQFLKKKWEQHQVLWKCKDVLLNQWQPSLCNWVQSGKTCDLPDDICLILLRSFNSILILQRKTVYCHLEMESLQLESLKLSCL